MTRRILYLIETLGHGGAEHQLIATVKRLNRAHFEPIVCHFRGPDYLAGELTAAGIRVVPLDIPAGKKSWPRLAARLRRLARDERADLIHTSLLEGDVIGGIAGRLAGVPVVSTLCNVAGDPARLTDNPRNNRLKFMATNLIWGGSLRKLHVHSVAISRAVQESAVSTFGMNAKKISVIYRGIEAERPGPQNAADEVKERIGLGKAFPLLLSIGRLAPQKGHKYLIAALPELLRHFPEAKLAIVGEGWLRPKLEAQAESLGVDSHVKFLGKRTDIPDLFAACDVFVFPSLFEGLGVSLVEAIFAGCTCVSTDTGPIPEIITNEETGILVPVADSHALARALVRLAGDPELSRRLGAAARRRALDRFMLDDKVRALEALYTKLLAG